MREERDTAKSELNQLKEELAARDKFIVNLQAQLGEKEQAIATLQAQSQQQLQLTLPLMTDSLDPAVTSQESEVSSQESKPDSKPKILKSSETADYINQNFNPEKLITRQNLTDAARGASKKMPEYERLYGLKFLGKIKGEYAYEILS